MKSIEEFLRNEVESKKAPSVQYAFFNTDRILSEYSWGFKNVSTNEPVSSATTYNLFSITKTFTALAVLQLAQQGKLLLDAPAINYLPDFPYQERITVRQLLNHTSGIPNPIPLKWIHLAEEHNGFDSRTFFDSLFRKHTTLSFEPGTKFSYSNLGYVLLGRLIEKVTSLSYEEYIKKYILNACTIKYPDLGFTIDPAVHATGYHRVWSVSYPLLGLLIDKSKFMGTRTGGWKAFRFFNNNGAPYGGLTGSRNGLIQYAQAILRKDSSLLDDEYFKVLFEGCSINNKPTGMSSSWFTGELNDELYFAHAGGGGGYYVELRLYPNSGKGSVILFNRSGMRDERILDKTDVFVLEKSGQKFH
jgi:CubicO group peptidase (beta-lactamase class C family)